MPEDNALVAPGGALYYNYFMQTTRMADYNRNGVKKTDAAQTVYLEPKNKQFAALIVTKQPKPTYANGTYYYVEQLEIRLGRDAVIFDDDDIRIQARVMDVLTHTETPVDLSYTLDSTGTKIVSIAGHMLYNPIDIQKDIKANRGSWIGNAYGTYVTNTANLGIYDIKHDTHYTTVNDIRSDFKGAASTGTTLDALIGHTDSLLPDPNNPPITNTPKKAQLYDNNDFSVTVNHWYYLKDSALDIDRDGIAEDAQGNDIIFAIVDCPDGATRTVIWDRYKKVIADSGSTPNIDDDVDSNPETFGQHIWVVYNAANLSHQYKEAGINSISYTLADAVTEDHEYYVNRGNLLQQFAFYDGGKLDYDVQQTVKDCYGYDDDASNCFTISSDIFGLYETSSRVSVTARHDEKNWTGTIWDYFHALDDAHVNKTIPKHFNDEHVAYIWPENLTKTNFVYDADDDATVFVTEDTQVISYVKNALLAYWDYDPNHVDEVDDYGNIKTDPATGEPYEPHMVGNNYAYWNNENKIHPDEVEADGTVKINPATGKPYEPHAVGRSGQITYVDTYNYNEFEQFGITGNPYVLVVSYKDNVKNAEYAKYIVVIADYGNASAAIKHYKNYGIYTGFNEVSESKLKVNLLDPYTGKVSEVEVANNATYNALINERHVGYVFGVNNDGTVELAPEPEQVLFANYNYIVTPSGVKNLKDPTYIYVGRNGGFYVSSVDKDFIQVNRDAIHVGVYANADQTTTVVIWPTDVVEGYYDGHPNYGTIDVNWDQNTHDDPNWNSAD